MTGVQAQQAGQVQLAGQAGIVTYYLDDDGDFAVIL
jgi:hypothetical protein